MRIAITGIGVVSPLGSGTDALFAALESGRSAVARDADGAYTARIGDFGVKERIAAASLRRLPRLSQLAIVAAKEALGIVGSGGEPPLPYPRERIGVVLGTGLGTLAETIAFMRGYLEGGVEAASPALFPLSVMNAAAGQLAIECGLGGANSTVNHREASALAAVALARDLLLFGRADALLAGGVDELSAPALVGYRHLGGLSQAGMRPYSEERDGLGLGEGAALLLLEREETARARGAHIRGWLTGSGESGDDRPRVGWGHGARFDEARRAVVAAAGGQALDWIAGGGNGTRFDEHELATLEAALGPLPPISSVLGQLGESFVSPLLRLVAALFALERQRLPGSAGLTTPLARFAEAIVARSRPAAVRRVLVPVFAQGGANLALVVEGAGRASGS